jgi:hypothetical protein
MLQCLHQMRQQDLICPTKKRIEATYEANWLVKKEQ